MKNKTLVLITLLLTISGLLLAACGGAAPAAPEPAPAEANQPEEASPAGEEPAPAEAEAVTVRVWTHQNNAFNDGLQKLADAYTAAHPNVTISFETFDYDTYIQTLQTALPAGTEADILQMFGTWTCSYAANLAPVPAEVLSLDEAHSKFFDAPLNGYVCDDTLYGLPQEFNIEYGATLVNTQLAQEAGIENIAAGWPDWDAFKVDAQAMTVVQDEVVTRAGYHFTAGDHLAFTMLSLIKQQGGNYLNDAGTAFTLDTPEGRQALELMQSIVEAGITDPVLFNDEANWTGDCYFEQNCAMGLIGPWVIAEYAADFPEVREATVYVPLPSLGDQATFVADSGWGLTVSKNSPVQAAAWDFVSFVALNEANALDWNIGSGTLPALRANTAGDAAAKLVSEFPYFEPFLTILPNGQYIGNLPDRDLFWYDIAYPHILNYLQGNEGLDEALKAMEQEANETFN